MNKKRFMDIIICLLALATGILAYTYIEQVEIKRMIGWTCCVFFIVFLCMFFADSDNRKRKKERNRKNRIIQMLELLDEEGSTITSWNIGGKTAVLIGRDTHKESVDINLQNTAYGGMVDAYHAVLNYAGNQWYIEDLNSKNGVQIRKKEDGKVYKLSNNHPCQIHRGDIIYIGYTQLLVN